MKVIFIRHGETAGNAEKRYIGRTDQPLTTDGAATINSRAYPVTELVFASPLTRCLQTAALIYPTQKPIIIPDLREMDFGLFENRNYEELKNEPKYQKWLDSGGKTSFPGGEHPEDFSRRCRTAFSQAMANISRGTNSAAFVVHGGTIMAILSGFANPPGDYFSYMVKNGGGYICDYADGQLQNLLPLFE